MSERELRELDAWVAERVMGVNVIKCPIVPANVSKKDTFDDSAYIQYRKAYPLSVPNRVRHYTTDPAAAMEVLKKCLQHEKMQCGFAIGYSKGFPHPFVVDDCIGDSLEICICLFAKKLFTK